MNGNNPLTKADVTMCRRMCGELVDCKQQIEAAKRAGHPNIDELEARCVNAQQRFEAIVAEYGEAFK